MFLSNSDNSPQHLFQNQCPRVKVIFLNIIKKISIFDEKYLMNDDY